jgi:hypothetical protein
MMYFHEQIVQIIGDLILLDCAFIVGCWTEKDLVSVLHGQWRITELATILKGQKFAK